MIELQLVGYTADLEYLVFCDAAEGASRFKAPVDEDLLATLTEVVERTDGGRPTAFLPPRAAAAPAPAPPPPLPPPPPPPPARTGPRPGVGPLAAVAVLLEAAGEPPAADVPADGLDATPPISSPRGSRLSPREIQALLRMGRTPEHIAKQAGVDENWVQRWLPPIEAERARILASARQARVSKARKGPSAHPLGEAVDRNLADKNAGEDAEWSATRRDGDPYWVVSVRYRSRGKVRRARWRFDPEQRDVEPEDAAARELAWTAPHGDGGMSGRDTPAPTKRARAKKRATKAPAGKRAAKKTATGKRAVAKKATAKQPTAKKAAAKKAVAKKAVAKKPAATRTAVAQKTVAKKAVAKKAPTKKTPVGKKAVAKKPATKKTTASKRTTKKAATRRPAAQRTTRPAQRDPTGPPGPAAGTAVPPAPAPGMPLPSVRVPQPPPAIDPAAPPAPPGEPGAPTQPDDALQAEDTGSGGPPPPAS